MSKLLNRKVVQSELVQRVMDGDQLTDSALLCYRTLKSKPKIRGMADFNRSYYAKRGFYLKALIHDQIYRLHGGVD